MCSEFQSEISVVHIPFWEARIRMVCQSSEGEVLSVLVLLRLEGVGGDGRWCVIRV